MTTTDAPNVATTLDPAETFDLPPADAPITNPYPDLAALRGEEGRAQ